MKKILLIRFSSIGDIVLTSPVARCIKKQVPNSEVHFLTKKSFESIVSLNPNIDKVYCIEKSIDEVIAQLKDENYDYIVDLHYNIRSVLVKMRLNKPFKTVRKLNFKKWLLVFFKSRKIRTKHIVERYLDAAKNLGVTNDNLGLDFFIPEKDEVALSSLPLSHQQAYIAFVIGAKHFTKRLPKKKILSICKKIQQPIILLGGPEDKAVADYISAEMGAQVYNACGAYNLQQSASLVKQAKKVITHDTGLMHIAAAFKKEIVSIWGSTVPEFGMYPYLPKGAKQAVMIEVKGLSCRPCSKIGFNKCPKGHFNCMNTINEELVAGE
jgi:lipopolysaccharide heptosyltransferase II